VKRLLNTLYVMTQGAYLRLDHETLVMEVEKEKARQMPLHPLSSIVVIGNVMVSPFLISRCAGDGRSMVFLDKRGRFEYRISGQVSGNVLLRRAQHNALSNSNQSALIARNMVAGKLQNARNVLLRAARETDDNDSKEKLRPRIDMHGESIKRLDSASSLDEIRGIEGMAASAYFEAFPCLIRVDDSFFNFHGRSRRPPRDAVNATLSFLYTLLRFECSSALEGVGLDPQVGYLHSLRSGRPALALDLMEELRPVMADRITLTLVNRRQLGKKDFEERTGGAIYLDESGRKTVITAWQNRKKEEVNHPVLKKPVPWGLIPHIQAQLLARHLRGDLDCYVPFLWR